MKLVRFTDFIKRYSWGHLVVGGGFLLAGIVLKTDNPWGIIAGILVFAVVALIFGLMTED